MTTLASDEDIKRTILRKLIRKEYIGGRHTSIENLPKGFPKSDRGKVKKQAKKLLKQGYFIVHVKPDALHISLNPKFLPKIKEEIRSEKK